MKTQLNFGLIGAGFIGRSHALALSAVGMVFADCPISARRDVLCDVDPARAAASADAFGFSASGSTVVGGLRSGNNSRIKLSKAR